MISFINLPRHENTLRGAGLTSHSFGRSTEEYVSSLEVTDVHFFFFLHI